MNIGLEPLHLKQTFPPIILIFTEGEGDGIESRLPFKISSTLSTYFHFDSSFNLKIHPNKIFSATSRLDFLEEMRFEREKNTHLLQVSASCAACQNVSFHQKKRIVLMKIWLKKNPIQKHKGKKHPLKVATSQKVFSISSYLRLFYLNANG